MLSKFEKWIVSKIIRRNLFDGVNQNNTIASVYQLIRNVAREECPEDNEPTLNVFLQECFERTQFHMPPPQPVPHVSAEPPEQPEIIQTNRIQAIEFDF